ncbi:RidA family protein [Thalassococcus sp. S3]|uniref:RidA family protein n=1 Tax=Thalassococcus sp. S3 TaxID=2017482 RepID=UPI0010246B79|nr:RidA family protein [Thalassococcus sp. S3]QBF30790.1 enamine deaminase RidA [Thalassococcus sp. S3]
MNRRSINSPDAPGASGGYAQAVETTGAQRVVYVSGQIPVSRDGKVPETFREQAELAWRNVEAQLHAADMGLENIIKHTTFLSDRRYRQINSEVRREVLGNLEAALTVIITGIYDEAWLLEIEVIAAS